jgi:hypothetical protein
MCGMFLQSTLPIKEAQWIQLRLSKIYGTKPGRPSLSPATKKRYRYRDQVEADISEMSESEIHAVME